MNEFDIRQDTKQIAVFITQHDAERYDVLIYQYPEACGEQLSMATQTVVRLGEPFSYTELESKQRYIRNLVRNLKRKYPDIIIRTYGLYAKK